jgi:tagaturonate reductase
MNLSRKMMGQITYPGVEIPPESCFGLPERVLQFGTGVLLRALPDYFIDKANKKGIFNGRILMVKSTGKGDTRSYESQDGMYTLCVKGLVEGKKVEEYLIHAAVSRVLSAKTQWLEVLACASNPEMELVISNTTEVGIQLVNDSIHANPPESFPGKLLAFLQARYLAFRGDPSRGMVIVPTELLPSNGDRLREILIELAKQNELPEEFRQWLIMANHFCNSLVDRIVPGKLTSALESEAEQVLGYHDELMIMAEPYRLWAIETAHPRVRQVLSFSQVDKGMVLAPDISLFRELKIRLLNGPHTFCCGLAHLSGFQTVKDAMENLGFSDYIRSLVFREIIPAIEDPLLSPEQTLPFAEQVLDRFRNPFMEHQWLSITLQYSSKMRMRNVPILLHYFERFGRVPELMSLGFAAYLLFMKSVRTKDGQYYGEANGKPYLVIDEQAPYYAEQWKNPENIVGRILANIKLWGTDLSELPGFSIAISEKLRGLMEGGTPGPWVNLAPSKQFG